MGDVKKTSLNLDPSVVAEAKIAIVEAEHLGIDAPRNLSALVNDSLSKVTRTLREEIDRTRAARADQNRSTPAVPGKPGPSGPKSAANPRGR